MLASALHRALKFPPCIFFYRCTERATYQLFREA